ncbi:acyltransferase family protein [Microbacterium sp. NPDC058389]|uniref:acyltransferase family protein n=1 Tax=Microbacterium sp. NPDC058389 TaxID=3346475 RepID=UPI00364BBD8D
MTAKPSTSTRSAAPVVRAEIQALRAVAVLGVLLFHLWPQRLPGGYVGVDVFFVVSGFLITAHLIRERTASGHISLSRFWARRVRRLLPGSLLVLAATALGVWAFVPESRWAQFGGEIVASVLYVENWALAAQSVDYMALSNVKSPVQHFWSLGVEEQFYLLWPLLIILAFVLATRWRRVARTAVPLVLGLVVVASLTLSIVQTAADPSVAYFSTFTRGWEFGLGALLALLIGKVAEPIPERLAPVVSWLGFAFIAVSMILYTGTTPFPSFTALLPVVGALAVIAAGTPARRGSPAPLFRLRPVQFVGDVSYGAYLWHWPLIVLFPYAFGFQIGTVVAIALLAVSLVLGWASKRFVEDPIRTAKLVARSRTAWTFAGAAAVMALVIAIAAPLATHVITPPAPPTADGVPDCYAAAAMLDEDCDPVEQVPLVASLASFSIDLPPQEFRDCERATTAGEARRCDFGPIPATGPHVALIGDSHGTRIAEPLRDAVSAEGGTLTTYLVSGCAMMSRELTGSAWGFEQAYAEQCRDVTTSVHDAVAADPDIDTVVLTNRTRLYMSDAAAFHPLTTAEIESSIQALQAAGKRVIVLRDPPEMSAIPPQGGQSAADCLAAAPNPSACSLPLGAADFADPMVAAARATGVDVIDLDDAFCDSTRCMSRIGGVVVYTDDNHLTRSFALSLEGRLAEALHADGE